MGYYRSGKAIYFKNTDDEQPVLIADCENEEKAHFIVDAISSKSNNFIKDALVTCSPEFHGDMVAWNEFKGRLNGAIDALNKLDQVKKTLFYGRDNNLIAQGQRDATDIPTLIDSNRAVAVDIIHAILGNATEAGELLEALKNAINGNGFDWINIQEELGDQAWYNAILAERGDFTFEDYEQRIIKKLRSRYADKFSSAEAITRDLISERAILEDKLTPLSESHTTMQDEGDLINPPRLLPTSPVSGSEAIEGIEPAVNAAFDSLKVSDTSVDAPATEGGSGFELHKSPAERMHKLPGEDLAHQPVDPSKL